jgi:4-amino-4-deoxy-L-arabinose transferase-like glycosyltransferase
MREATRANRTVALLLVSLLQMFIAGLLLNNLSMEGWSVIQAEDSEGYLLVARCFLGEDIQSDSLPLFKYRLLSPLVPFAAALLARMIPLEYAFLLINCLLWLLSVYLFYRFSNRLLNEKSSFYCALLYTSSLPLTIWGLPIMVDMAAFFFAILFCLLVTPAGSAKKGNSLAIAITLSLAILAKPSLVALLLFFLLYAVMQKQYGRALAVVSVSVSAVVGIYFLLGLGIEDFLAYGYLRHRGVFYVLNALVFCFHWGLPLAVWGFLRQKQDRLFYLTYLVSTFGCYLSFVHNPRLLFLIFPAVLPLVTSGMEACAQRISRRRNYEPRRSLAGLAGCYMLTSTILAALYLYITRVLQYRSLESIRHLFG